MITRDQAIRGDVFVSIDPGTGKCNHFYRTRGMTNVPAEYRSGKCKTWKRRPLAFRVKLMFGSISRTRSVTVASEHGCDAIGYELLDQYLARQRYGFGPDTPVGIIADRLKDDGEDAWADRVLCLPKVTV